MKKQPSPPTSSCALDSALAKMQEVIDHLIDIMPPSKSEDKLIEK